MITPDDRARVRRLFYVEHQTVNAIAAATGLHHETVKQAINAQAFRSHSAKVRPSIVDPHEARIMEIVERLPKIRSTRLTEILRGYGYNGSVHQVRRRLRIIRRKTAASCYLRLTLHPGEQAQCDWAHFGTLTVGRAVRKLSCFVMVLSYSRLMYARFTFDQTLESFLRGHIDAFRAFQGVPRVVLYDNLKAAVTERMGRAVRFNPSLLELAGHYHFRPEPCNPARGNEKGRVERAIGYLRTSFYPGRHFKDLADANEQLAAWLSSVANVRSWPEDRSVKVTEAYEREREKLLALPEHEADSWHIRSVRSDKTAYVRFDLNDYTIPHRHCRKPLTLMASESEVRLLDGLEEITRHRRSYDKGERVECREHIEALLAEKGRALPARRRDALSEIIPEAEALVVMLIERGEPLKGHLRRLYDLVERYGQKIVQAAVIEAASRGTPRSESVEHLIHQQDKKRKSPPVLPVHLPDRPGVKDLAVKFHSLDQYDKLKKAAEQT